LRVSLLRSTPEAELLVASAARLCYSSSDPASIEEELRGDPCKVERLLEGLLRSGHLSPFEHAQFTFMVDGVSRACSHQLVRHRIASYSQRSQRYVRGSPEMVVPPSIRRNQDLLERVVSFLLDSTRLYEELLARGIPPEDARFVLPQASSTSLVVSMNARELLHFFSLRLCRRAQWEIRSLAKRMLSLCLREAPALFRRAGPSCLSSGRCQEERGCGRPYASQEELLGEEEHA